VELTEDMLPNDLRIWAYLQDMAHLAALCTDPKNLQERTTVLCVRRLGGGGLSVLGVYRCRLPKPGGEQNEEETAKDTVRAL